LDAPWLGEIAQLFGRAATVRERTFETLVALFRVPLAGAPP